MDELANLTFENFDDDTPFPPARFDTSCRYNIIRIRNGAVEERSVPYSELLADFQNTREKASCTFLMVPGYGCGPRIDGRLLKQVLIEHMHVSSCVLWYIQTKADNGFYRFPGPHSISFVTMTSRYTVIWVFDVRENSTAGVFLGREYHNDEAASGFLRSLSHYCRHATSPALPAFLASLEDIDYLDRQIENPEQLLYIISMKQYQLLYPFRILPFRSLNETLDDLHMLSRHLVGFANARRMTRMMSSAMSTIQDGIGSDLGLPQEAEDAMDQMSRTLKPAALVLASRISAFEDWVNNLEDRCNQHKDLLQAYLTHGDAVIGLDLSKRTARLAEKTTEDSSSMKTIAIMTMAFLPATFFAALFALPSLDWKGDVVIQENFWIYWAFTLPATGLVLLIWFLLNYRPLIMKLLGSKQTATTTSEASSRVMPASSPPPPSPPPTSLSGTVRQRIGG
ncbi:hypothetical protein GGR56DRAFT_535247 [Xylariaceae sp. FL0804]|nr:hypothetical protein GGR56DRAFT_535247 [Xylariaceae sp. FL0804]